MTLPLTFTYFNKVRIKTQKITSLIPNTLNIRENLKKNYAEWIELLRMGTGGRLM